MLTRKMPPGATASHELHPVAAGRGAIPSARENLPSSMLLNELKKPHELFEAQSERLRGLEARLDAVESRTSR